MIHLLSNSIILQVIVKIRVVGKLCNDSNGFRAKNFYVFTSSADIIREIINSLRRGNMISAHTADSAHTEVLMLVQMFESFTQISPSGVL